MQVFGEELSKYRNGLVNKDEEDLPAETDEVQMTSQTLRPADLPNIPSLSIWNS